MWNGRWSTLKDSDNESGDDLHAEADVSIPSRNRMTKLSKHFGSWLALTLLGMSLLFLTGCSPFVDNDQPIVSSDAMVTLEPGHTVGQTFVARHGGLNGIEVWLRPNPDAHGEVQVHVQSDPGASDDLGFGKLPLNEITSPGFYRIAFSPLWDSHSRYYYVFLEVIGNGQVEIGGAKGGTYIDGALYHDREPKDAQLAFRLTYDPIWLLSDLMGALVGGLGLLGVTALLYLVPGYALLTWLWPEDDLPSGPVRMGVAAGLSLALYPLLFLWTDLVGLHLGPLYAWLPLLISLTFLMWHYRLWRFSFSSLAKLFRNWVKSSAFWPDVALVALMLLTCVVRFLPARAMEMPFWDDSVQHVAIVQRMLETKGLFRSWEPYAPYHSFSAHFGFHASVASWAWLTHVDSATAVIWAGQALNLLAVLTLYPLAHSIGGRWGGASAVLGAGLLSQFPAYYVNWGRYPQMAGQVMLPVAAFWLWEAFRSRKALSRWALGGALLTGGLFLTYYRMPFHLLAFAIAGLLALPALGRKRDWWRIGRLLAILGVMALITVLPWLARVISCHPGVMSPNVGEDAEPVSTWRLLEAVHVGWDGEVAALMLLGIAFIPHSRRNILALPILWIWLLMLLPVLRNTPLPGVSIIQEFTIRTSLYIPLNLIGAGVVGSTADWLLRRRPGLLKASALSLALVIVGIYKLPAALGVLDRGFDLASRPDMRAARWVDQHLPATAFFLINGIVYTDGHSAVGGDAGWWLPVLTGRGVVIPPQYALLGEEPNEPGYGESVSRLVRTLFEAAPTSPAGLEEICRFPVPITHVFIGQRQGMVSKALPFPPAHPMLSPRLLMEHPAFRLIYHEDRVMIFEFERIFCSQ